MTEANSPRPGAASSLNEVQLNRRETLRAAAWSLPVVAVTMSTPMAAATTAVRSDLVLSFGDTLQGSTRDISFAVIDFIERAIRGIGPQEPSAPELTLPPEPTRPPGFPNPIDPAWQEYSAAYAQWLLDVAAANADYATLVAQYLQELARWTVWDLAVKAIVQQLRDVALQTEGLFFASVTYPRSVRVHNAGPEELPAGTVVTVQLDVDNNLVNAHLPQLGPVQVVQTGGVSTLSYVTPAPVAVGAEVFSQQLLYNPAAVTLNIGGEVQQSSITALLAPASQDTDVNDHGDVATSDIGVLLNVATGDVQAILAQWQNLIDSAIAFYELVEPFLPEIDWSDIFSGRLALD